MPVSEDTRRRHLPFLSIIPGNASANFSMVSLPEIPPSSAYSSQSSIFSPSSVGRYGGLKMTRSNSEQIPEVRLVLMTSGPNAAADLHACGLMSVAITFFVTLNA